MKYVIIILFVLAICIGISIGIALIIKHKTKLNKKRYVVIFSISISFILLICCFFMYTGIYYHADKRVKDYLVSDSEVTVTKESSYYFFDGKGSSNAIIFYPGAKVEYTSYAPMMHKLAESGIDCFLVKMPLNFAFLGSNKASSIIKKYDYESYYMMGHSLGGVVASSYASGNSKIKGVILLASYTTKSLSDKDVLSIYGSLDGCLNRNAYEKNKKNLPSNYSETVIEGGNHAQFGLYGSQSGDKKATISYEMQQFIAINAIIEFFNK